MFPSTISPRRVAILALPLIFVLGVPVAALSDDARPTGDPAEVPYEEAVYTGEGGSYSLERDAFGKPNARGTIVLKSKETGEWEAHETVLSFENGLSLQLEGWRGTYKGMVFKTDFVDSSLPTHVFLATEGSTIKSRHHFHATALWNRAQGKWLPNESAIRSKRRK
jgi:hypothetical protein